MKNPLWLSPLILISLFPFAKLGIADSSPCATGTQESAPQVPVISLAEGVVGQIANSQDLSTADRDFINKLQAAFNDLGRRDLQIELYDSSSEMLDSRLFVPYVAYGSTRLGVLRSLVGEVDPKDLAQRIVELERIEAEARDRAKTARWGLSTKKLNTDPEAIRQQMTDDFLKSGKQAELSMDFRRVARKMKASPLETSGAPERPSFESRMKGSFENAKVILSAGGMKQNPLPGSVSAAIGTEVSARFHPLLLAFDKTSMTEAPFVEANAYGYQFFNGHQNYGGAIALGLQGKAAEAFVRQYVDHFSGAPEGMEDRARYMENKGRTVGFKIKFEDEKNKDSQVYIRYESFKLNDSPFNGEAIRQTALANPNWPMVHYRDPNFRLLLGYILSMGVVADITDSFPESPSILGQMFGRKKVFFEANLRGSAMGTDDPDALEIRGGAKVKIGDKFYAGFMVTYQTDLGSNRFTPGLPKEVRSAMAFIEIPFNEEPYVRRNTPVDPGPKSWTVRDVSVYHRQYAGKLPMLNRSPLYRNGEETQIKTSQEGILAEVEKGRFIVNAEAFHAFGKSLAGNPEQSGPSATGGEAKLRYRVSEKLEPYVVFRGEQGLNRDLYQVGAGVQANLIR